MKQPGQRVERHREDTERGNWRVCNQIGQKKGGFQSPQALSKAMKRVRMALPSSPTHATLTLQNVARNVGLEMKKKMLNNLKVLKALSELVKKLKG